MDDYKRESFYGSANFDDYEFIQEEGSFDCTYVGRWMNKDDNLVCCFDFDDGSKVRAMAWQNTNYYRLDKIPLGTRLCLEFRQSGSGRNYLRKATILGGKNR